MPMYHLDLFHTTLLLIYFYTWLKQCLDINTSGHKKVDKKRWPYMRHFPFEQCQASTPEPISFVIM